MVKMGKLITLLHDNLFRLFHSITSGKQTAVPIKDWGIK